MFKIYRPKKDSTIYGYEKRLNSGIDSVLELNTNEIEQSGEYSSSRILIQFPKLDQEFSSFVKNGSNVLVSYGYETVIRNQSNNDGQETGGNTIFNVTTEQAIENSSLGNPNVFAFFGQQLAPERNEEIDQPVREPIEKNDPSAWLRLWFAQGEGMSRNYTIEALPVEEKWKEGRGRKSNSPPTKEPVNWIERTDSESWNEEGGDFKNAPKSAEKFKDEDPDVYMQVNAILSEGLDHGILIKRKDENLNRLSKLSFFSKDTRTIYVPQLLVGTDTYEFDTEGANPVETQNFTAQVSSMDRIYPQSLVRFNVTVEEKYKQRDFLGVRPTEDRIKTPTYLPKRSLTWGVEDVRTGLMYFPFNEKYSPVSFDGKTHYFNADLTNLFPKREYKVIFKYTDPQTGTEQIFDHNQTFKVSDGT